MDDTDIVRFMYSDMGGIVVLLTLLISLFCLAERRSIILFFNFDSQMYIWYYNFCPHICICIRYFHIFVNMFVLVLGTSFLSTYLYLHYRKIDTDVRSLKENNSSWNTCSISLLLSTEIRYGV